MGEWTCFEGLDAGLALGGATLDLTPLEYDGGVDLLPIWDGRVDLFWGLDAGLALGGSRF